MVLRKGDRVIIIAGKDKDIEGVILDVNPKKNKIKVEGVAITHYHRKPTQSDQEGGIAKEEGWIDASNAIMISSTEKKKKQKGKVEKVNVTRIGFRYEDEKNKKKKYRYSKKTNQKI